MAFTCAVTVQGGHTLHPELSNGFRAASLHTNKEDDEDQSKTAEVSSTLAHSLPLRCDAHVADR